MWEDVVVNNLALLPCLQSMVDGPTGGGGLPGRPMGNAPH